MSGEAKELDLSVDADVLKGKNSLELLMESLSKRKPQGPMYPPMKRIQLLSQVKEEFREEKGKLWLLR